MAPAYSGQFLRAIGNAERIPVMSFGGSTAVGKKVTLAVKDCLEGRVWAQIFIAGVHNLKPPKTYSNVEFPPERKLPSVEKNPPLLINKKPPKMMRHLIDMRGPEPIHTNLIHKQYGVRSILGGAMQWQHFEDIQRYVNKRMDLKRMFTIWRVDPPWKSVSKKSQGHRMGGGKASVDHFVTPVKSGRIIIELGGTADYEEVYPILRHVSNILPFQAEPVEHTAMEVEKEKLKQLESMNVNPFTFEYCIKNNFLGSRKWASPFDYLWFGKHR